MKRLLTIAIVCIGIQVSGQGIRDSLFAIEQVEIRSAREFRKEEAGMKETRIDSFLIETQVQMDLADLLSENSIIHIKNYGRGALSTASFRGTAPSHTQVTWNGMNINSPMLGMVDFSLVPLMIIDEVTILHGAASIGSSGGGLGGLVEIGNKPDWTNKFGGKVMSGYGSFQTSNLFGGLELGNTRFQSKTGIYTSASENNYPFVNKNIIEKDSLTGELYHPLQKNKNADYSKYGLNQEFYFRPKENLVISNRTWGQIAERSVPTVLSNEYSDESLQRENRQFDQTLKNVTTVDRFLENGSLKIRSGIDLQRLDYSMVSQVPGLSEQTNVDSESRMFSWYNYADIKHDFSKKVSAELQGAFNRYEISTFDSAVLAGYDTVRLESSILGGIYFHPREKVNFLFQLRKEFISGYSTPLIFVAGTNFKPFGNHNFILKGNLSRNYHHPTLNDLYWQPGGNPDLLPEKGYTGELTASCSAETALFSGKTSLTGYYSKISNWILWLPGFKGYWEPMNIKEVRSYGLEYQLSAAMKIRQTTIRFYGTFTLTNTLNYGDPLSAGDISYKQQLPYIPKVAGNAFISLTNRGFYLKFQHSSTGSRHLLSSNRSVPDDDSAIILPGTDTGNLYTLYPHFLNDMALGKTVSNAFGDITIELNIDNILNETYRNVLHRFMPGRSYHFSLKINF